MAVSIGAVTCTYLRGVMPDPRPRQRIWETPGISGYGQVLLGEGDSQCELTAQLATNLAGALLFKSNLEALTGSQVVVVNDHGQSKTCIVERVDVDNMTIEAAVSTGGVTRLATVRVLVRTLN